MQRLPSRGKADRPQAKQAQSYPRHESSPTSPAARSRSSSVKEGKPLPTENAAEEPSSALGTKGHTSDLFDTHEDGEPAEDEVDVQFPEGFDELPVEIQSLVERFLESLAAKVHPIPLSIERLSELYQDFYEHTQTQIATHIAALSTRLFRDTSPTPSASSTGSFPSKAGSRKNSRTLDQNVVPAGEQQMLTASEITDKRKARRQLELKRIALEEAVERGVCEKVYPRIWRHRSTDDAERDEKLRSRAAALSVIGISLHELLTTALSADGGKAADLQETPETNATAQALLVEARQSLEQMNQERYPLGKISHLMSVHKNIVEALQQMFPSSSSADEVLPTLIYTIISSPPASVCVISNLNFIQRFRKSSKINGEVAYCLTNLEAAISFLETVDLSSIRPSESLQGPGKSGSHSSTPRSETPDPMYRGLASNSAVILRDPKSSLKDSAGSASPTRPRRFSNLIHSRNTPLETASGAVLTGADNAFDTIHGALDGSFKFLFGRLRERQATNSPDGSSEIAAPKTLEDARKLVSPNLSAEDEAESAAPEGDGAAADQPAAATREEGNKVLDLVGGRRMTRERSADSTNSSVSSSKRAAAAEKPSSSSSSAVESMRSLGSAFNPLNPLRGIAGAGMGMMRGFGAASSTSSKPATPAPAASVAALPPPAATVASPVDMAAIIESPAPSALDASGIPPPMKRFVELKEPKELNFFDVELLLRDYQRLAGALKAAGGPAAV